MHTQAKNMLMFIDFGVDLNRMFHIVNELIHPQHNAYFNHKIEWFL